jgi:hypothetical protein
MKIFNVDSEAKKKSKVNEVYAEFLKTTNQLGKLCLRGTCIVGV